jgi:predicted PurR-regulated permease PerM
MILGFFLILFLLSFITLGWLVWPFISTIVLASVVTGFFQPVYQLLNAKHGIRPAVASSATCLLIFITLFVPIVLFVGILSTEAYGFYQMARNAVLSDEIKTLLSRSWIIDQTNQLLSNFNMQLTGEAFNEAFSQVGKVVGLFLYEQASAIATNILRFVGHFFFMLLIIYFLLIDGYKLLIFIFNLSPLPDEQNRKLIRKFKDMAGAILFGNGLCGLIQGFAGGVVFGFFGLNSPFLWGVIMALLAFLPIVGIGLVFIPAAVYLFLKNRIAAGIFFVLFYIVLSGGIEYLLKPKLVGNKLQMHTLLVFLSIMGGLKLFGILGVIYGPLIVTAFLTLTDIYKTSYQQELL